MSKAGKVAWNRHGASGKGNSGWFAIHRFDGDSFSPDRISDADVPSPRPGPPAHVRRRALQQVL